MYLSRLTRKPDITFAPARHIIWLYLTDRRVTRCESSVLITPRSSDTTLVSDVWVFNTLLVSDSWVSAQHWFTCWCVPNCNQSFARAYDEALSCDKKSSSPRNGSNPGAGQNVSGPDNQQDGSRPGNGRKGPSPGAE